MERGFLEITAGDDAEQEDSPRRKPHDRSLRIAKYIRSIIWGLA
jgi:hypothetical protein